MDYNTKREDAKIVDIIFDNQEGEWEEVTEEVEPVNFQDLSETSEPWYARLIALAILGLGLIGGVISLVFWTISVPFALVSYITKQEGWNLALHRWSTLFRRSMVISLVSFVGIFSVRFALSILMLYFTLYDPLPSLLGKAMGTFGKE